MFLSFSAQQKKHTVEAKETLYSIAKKYGDVSAQATVANDKTDASKKSVKETESETYVVQSKDTYYGITRKF